MQPEAPDRDSLPVSAIAIILLLVVVLKVGDWRLYIGYGILFLAWMLTGPWTPALRAGTTRLSALAPAVLPAHHRPTWLSRLLASATAAGRVLTHMDPRSEFEQAPRWAQICAIAFGVMGGVLLVASFPLWFLGGLSFELLLMIAGPAFLAIAVAAIYVGLALQTGLQIVQAVQAAWRATDAGLGGGVTGDEANEHST
jgi:hypothetical protein